jgi:hypothetical protein
MILHRTDVPLITSSFGLSSAVQAEILRAIDQSRMRLRKELKKSLKLERKETQRKEDEDSQKPAK